MSGGVDSSMALVLLKKQGWQPSGVSLKYAVWQDRDNLLRENICCSSESFKIAKSICKQLGVAHHIYDVSNDFKKQVIDYFISELKNNRTPNPCIICNRYLKFKKLFQWAGKHNIKYVATGHYACIKKNQKTNEYELRRAKDKAKDQTYNLGLLPQKWLKWIVFPLSSYTKKQVFKMAQEQGFDFYLKRKQSQDFCFVAGKCLNCFLEKEIGKNPGPIKNKQGKVLGEHQGLHFYTIGQRKGIKLSGGPYFVAGKDIKNNTLLVTKNKKDLYSKEALLCPYHFIVRPYSNTAIKIKIRSRHTPARATLKPVNSKVGAYCDTAALKIIFAKPQKAITPGQFAVFYQGDVCLGGGRINKSICSQLSRLN